MQARKRAIGFCMNYRTKVSQNSTKDQYREHSFFCVCTENIPRTVLNNVMRLLGSCFPHKYPNKMHSVVGGRTCN